MNITSTLPLAQEAKELPKNAPELREAAEGVESFFLYQMLELTQPKTDEDSIFNGGHAETLFRSTMNEITAENVTKSGGLGVADAIYDQLLKTQEQSQSEESQ